uniref:hypothetical protein n=1 Tax=Bacillus sp. B-3 TaxID=119423 RepID=UPI00159ED108|nr:hypothetical protein [Bacillus sp. B-3]
MTKEEKELFEKCLARYAEGKRFDYGVHDRKLYNSMKEKMDSVHAELGHGKNRFDFSFALHELTGAEKNVVFLRWRALQVN